ncbi:MAG: hypothetical protein M9890_06870 [Thermomicrobiales bacterium]|nr:hypothetical protein [Thermomicrobiales bacterium]
MNQQYDDMPVNPQLDAQLRSIAHAVRLDPARDRRIRDRIGLPISTGSQGSTAGHETGKPMSAMPPGPATRDDLPPRRMRPWLELVAGIAAIALVGIVLVAVFGSSDGSQPAAPGVGASPTTASPTVTVEPATPTIIPPTSTAVPEPTGTPLAPTGYTHADFWQTGINSWGGLRVGPDGAVYQVDTSVRTLHVFAPDGTETGTIAYGTTGAPMSTRDDVAVADDGTIYILDRNTTPRIIGYAPDGTVVTEWGGTVSMDAGSIFQAVAIAVDSHGYIYVADEDSRVQKFTTDGEFVEAWTRAGDNLFPTDIRKIVVHDDSLYVLANGYQHPDPVSVIMRFDLDGNLIGEPLTFDRGEDGRTPAPISFDVGPSGTVFITFASSLDIAEMTMDGEELARWSKVGNPNVPGSVLEIACNDDGRVYVADPQRGMIEVFRPVAQ